MGVWFVVGAGQATASDPFSTLHVFDEAGTANSPSGRTLLRNGVIYGTTRNNSTTLFTGNETLWAYDLETQQFETLYHFVDANEGRSVNASLAVIGSTLYGSTGGGGTVNHGTLWSYDLAGGGYQKKFDFNRSLSAEDPTNILAIGDRLIGTAWRGPNFEPLLWSFDPATHAFETLHELPGLIIPNDLLSVGEIIYGTSLNGPGSRLSGGLWSYDLQSGVYELLHSMDLTTDGRFPSGGLLDYDGSLYGLNGWGPQGVRSAGLLWKYDLAANIFSVLHVVQPDVDVASYPAGKMQLLGDKLVGTAQYAGEFTGGAMWTFDLATNTFKTIHDFEGPGAGPTGIDFLYQGKLFGTSVGYDVGSLWSFAIPEPRCATLGLSGVVSAALRRRTQKAAGRTPRLNV